MTTTIPHSTASRASDNNTGEVQEQTREVAAIISPAAATANHQKQAYPAPDPNQGKGKGKGKSSASGDEGELERRLQQWLNGITIGRPGGGDTSVSTPARRYDVTPLLRFAQQAGLDRPQPEQQQQEVGS